MSYVDGVVIAVKTTDKNAYLAFAREMDALFIAEGATRIIEGWADEVPHGQVTDFYRAVAAADDETVVFSWIEWPDKATRDAGWGRLEGNPAMAASQPPFDTKRMIFGGFAVLHQAGAA